MSISTELQSILDNDTTLQSLLTTYVYSSTTYYMCFSGILLPKEVKADGGKRELKISDSTVNHYNAGSVSGGESFLNTTYSISCRAYDVDSPLGEDKALAIQSACFDALNRVKTSSGKYFFVCTKLQPIAPANDNDNWNAPVDIRVMGSSE